MKKYFILYMLALAGMTENLCAQIGWTYFAGRSKTDQLFDVANTNWLRHRFIIQLSNGNNVTVQVTNKEQFEKLINLDSVLQNVAQNLKPLKDSFSNELTNKRVDFLIDPISKIRIRYREYPPRGNSYVLLQDGLMPMKIEQDTLVLIGYYRMTRAERVSAVGKYDVIPYKITVLVNNINQLETLLDGRLNKAMQQTKTEWDNYKKWTAEKNWKINLYSYYSTTGQKNVSLRQWYTTRPTRVYGQFYVQVAVQAINGSFATSTGAGADLVNKKSNTAYDHYQLLWEPYFFFDKTVDGKFKMQRNDFITFQVLRTSQSFTVDGKDKVAFNQNMSISYLVHRSGNYLNENTFKAGFPGIRYRNVILHAEFVFNDLFKNFQPSLKLLVFME